MAAAVTKIRINGFRGGGSYTLGTDRSSTAKVQFIVSFDSIPTTVADLEAAIGTTAGVLLPVRQTALPGDSLNPHRILTTYDIEASGERTGLDFVYTANYSQAEADPLDEYDTLSFEGTQATEEYFIDQNDERVVNTAYEPFDQLPERTTGAFRIIVEGNRPWADIDLALYATYLKPNSTNHSSFTVRGKTVGAGEAKMVAISATPTIAPDGTLYGRVRWEMECAPDWLDSFESRGYNELFGSPAFPAATLALRAIMKGVPPVKVDRPVPLDIAGRVQDPSFPPYILNFQPYPERDFSVFGWTAAI